MIKYLNVVKSVKLQDQIQKQ